MWIKQSSLARIIRYEFKNILYLFFFFFNYMFYNYFSRIQYAPPPPQPYQYPRMTVNILHNLNSFRFILII